MSGKLREIKSRQLVRKTRRKGFHPSAPGDLVQMDTVAIFTDGLKRYMFTAIDVTTRFAFAYTYKSESSANGRDFLKKFTTVAPFPVSRIQTDNGSEFLKYFARSCEDNDLVHYFNYPRHPQSNGHLERFNRTVQEQFVDWHTDALDEPEPFNRLLMNYLIWYNTERPHRGIGKLPPLRYYLNNFSLPEKSNMLWTLT
jgi:putative transposase